MFNKIQAAHSDEGRILLLNSLLKTMENDEEKNKFPEYIPVSLWCTKLILLQIPVSLLIYFIQICHTWSVSGQVSDGHNSDEYNDEYTRATYLRDWLYYERD